jgi:hypothetical protein
MARYDDLNTNFIAFFSVISCGLLLAVILAFQAFAFQMEYSEEERKLNVSEYTAANKALGEQRQSIGGYKWVSELAPVTDPAQKPAEVKRLNIPIQQAMELILREDSKPKAEPAQT